MKKYLANFVFSAKSPPIPKGVLIMDDHGMVLDVLENSDGLEDVLEVEGFLCPGFVNSHCHLELSHLRGMLGEKKGLVDFISPIIEMRKASAEVIQSSMRVAEQEMRANGIVAVGDICNTEDSFGLKSESEMHYHNYIEVLALDPAKAKSVFRDGIKLLDQSTEMGMPSSLVPHAPYTASADLLAMLGEKGRSTGGPLCIHNQESPHENKLFMDGTGPLRDLYTGLGNDLSFFAPTQTNSLEAVLKSVGGNVPLLLVHNTYTTTDDLSKVAEYNSQVSYCLCPNANLYIENRLPDIKLLGAADQLMVLGTDSLASNWTLSILDEMKTISASDPSIELATLISWATNNGAKFLGVDSELGSFEKGKRPGINLIYNVDLENIAIGQRSKVRVLS